ncbi:hypothetical protein [Deinococcus ruber]|uniref:Uncharacterized protein n=1 Tax=Deinococcus ruber TaxID=1848197 RepID=A0A918CKH1_9DEIO|nr:hypothetical protein [Deinococcus ruber]GGR26441.1 hypothetical protein GCM10008957_42490 [Deinococcus ruber]
MPKPVLTSTVRQSGAFKDASEQSVLVRDVRGSKLAKNCWLDYKSVTDEIFTRMEVHDSKKPEGSQ